jgi:NAD(P)-dependent dehydrogenase (short-subunit alcohol dehydrogenase family)
MRLAGKVGIVTAAASGMGRAGALRFAREGAKVGLADLNGNALTELVSEIEANGGTALALPGDLRDIGQAAQIVAKTVDKFSQLDFVWNHLGHPGPGKVEGMSQADFDIAVDLNLRSVIATTEAAIPEIRKRGGGSLLYTASASGLIGSRHSPVYSAMKHGVVGFAKALALRLAPENIRVNSICPGPIETPMLHTFGSRPDQPQKTVEEVAQGAINTVPMRRLGKPEEVAAAALFLISDDASFVTGVALSVDGGSTAD